MIKKSLNLFIAFLLTLVVGTSGCKDGKSGKIQLDVFQFKVEVVEQLDALVKDFEKEYPNIKVNMDTVGGGVNYPAALRTRVNSGEEPAVFNLGGQQELTDFFDFVEPLNDEAWVKQAFAGTLDSISRDGKVYGQPYGLEGYGMIYNKEILEKAGFSENDLKKIKNLAEFQKVLAAVDAKKKELGLEAVVSFSIGGSAWWTASIHAFNVPWALQKNPVEFINKARAGKVKLSTNKEFKNFVNFLDTLFKYSFKNLTTVEYNDQVTKFAQGKTAFLHQGNWTIGMIQEVNKNLKMAFLPHFLGKTGSYKSIPVGVPRYWCVNKKKSPEVVDAAKKFLNYIANTPRGHKFLVEEAKFIPAFKNVNVDKADPLAKSILEYSAKGRTLPWLWFALPSGYVNGPDSDIVKAFQAYYKNKDKKALLTTMETALITLDKKSKK
jgi:raffinose/stachyose/melibiose transport system substrate-binding protein